MIKLFKKLNVTNIIYIIICIVLVALSVNLDLKIPDYMSEITNLIKSEGILNDILIVGFKMVLCAFGSLIVTIVIGYLASKISAGFSKKLREAIFKKVSKFSQGEMKKFGIDSLITRTTNDVTQVEMLIGIGLQMLIKAPIMAVWAISKILNKSLELSIFTGICVAILLVIIVIIMILVLPKFSMVQKLIDDINLVSRENLTGVRVIRAFNAESYMEDKFDNKNKLLTKTQLFNQRAIGFIFPFINFIMNFLSLGIYFIGALLISTSIMSLKISMFSNVIVFTSYGIQVVLSFLMLAVIFMIVPRTEISARRINEVLDTDLEVLDGNANIIPSEIETVEFKDVSFKYPDADEYLLKDISFKANKGEVVAIVGGTGSGKSTLVNLIPRFYDVTSGEILVDNINIKDYKLNDLRSKLGYIPQRAFMFSDTITNNVLYGTVNSHKSTIKEAKEALKIAEASEFVDKLENKMDYKIASGGTNLSGGQKQRISISRALARNPEILIFDDSFSALDFKTDSKLRENIRKNMKDKTLFIVAQRVGTIMNADKIIVIDKGKIVGMGKHKELLNNCKVYQEICTSQLSKEELNA